MWVTLSECWSFVYFQFGVDENKFFWLWQLRPFGPGGRCQISQTRLRHAATLFLMTFCFFFFFCHAVFVSGRRQSVFTLSSFGVPSSVSNTLRLETCHVKKKHVIWHSAAKAGKTRLKKKKKLLPKIKTLSVFSNCGRFWSIKTRPGGQGSTGPGAQNVKPAETQKKNLSVNCSKFLEDSNLWRWRQFL